MLLLYYLLQPALELADNMQLGEQPSSDSFVEDFHLIIFSFNGSKNTDTDGSLKADSVSFEETTLNLNRFQLTTFQGDDYSDITWL